MLVLVSKGPQFKSQQFQVHYTFLNLYRGLTQKVIQEPANYLTLKGAVIALLVECSGKVNVSPSFKGPEFKSPQFQVHYTLLNLYWGLTQKVIQEPGNYLTLLKAVIAQLVECSGKVNVSPKC